MSVPGLAAFLLLECLVGAQAWFAHSDHVLTVAEMRTRGIDQGLPFVWHFGMWGDALIVSPLAAYLIGRYFRQWLVARSVLSLLLGVLVSVALHWIYRLSPLPEAHIQNHQLTAAGIGHLVYMAVAFAVFIQFFLFTPDVPAALLRGVSLLLLLHVVLGTHMALGILAIVSPQDWYPAKPLNSVFGWATLVALAVGLSWRNYGVAPVGWLWREFKYWTVQDDTTAEGLLKTLDYIAGWVGPSYFVGVISYRLAQSQALRDERWLAFGAEQALPLALIGLFWLIYFLSRHSAKEELAIGRTLFPPGRIPSDMSDLSSRLTIWLSVLGFLLLFCCLATFVDDLWAIAPIMFVIACIDFNTRRLINKGIRRYCRPRLCAVAGRQGLRRHQASASGRVPLSLRTTASGEGSRARARLRPVVYARHRRVASGRLAAHGRGLRRPDPHLGGQRDHHRPMAPRPPRAAARHRR